MPEATEIPDEKLKRGFYRLSEMRKMRKRGRVVFHLDGSGKVSEVEVVDKD